MLFKVINQVIFCLFSLVYLSTLFPATSEAQDLKVIKSVAEYRLQVQDDSLKQMVELKSIIPGIVYDLRYATRNNFSGEILYNQAEETFLRQPAAEALKKVQEELKREGWGLKIFDAYRPYSVTALMWQMLPDERYTADPAKGSGHNRGLSVDLTIVKLKTGDELNMGTGFDNFTDTASHSFNHLPELVLKNRKLLKTIMEKHSFKALETEWWHYSWPNDRNYEVLDIDFKKLRK